MTAKTMAEVLAEQLCGWNEDAPCGDCLDDAERYVGVLSAAGFGLVADAKAEAWDEGWAARAWRDPVYRVPDTNPYRAAQ